MLVLALLSSSGPVKGKLDVKNSIYFTEEGVPYQCGPMSYYGALCWEPDGVPKPPKAPKGYAWMLYPEVYPEGKRQ